MSEKLTKEEQLAREERNTYYRDYRKKNRKRILANQKKWREANPEKVKENNMNYWLRKAEARSQKKAK